MPREVMPDIAPLITDVQDAFQELAKQLQSFHQIISTDPQVRLYYLARVPYRKAQTKISRLSPDAEKTDMADDIDSDEELGVGRVTVEQLYAPGTREPATPEILKTAFDSFVSIQYEPDQDAKSTIRLPGLIAVSNATMEAAHEVNRAKARFKESVLAIPSRSRRSLARVLPGLVYLQAYRSLVILNETPREVAFIWSVNKSGIKRRTAQEIIDQLEKEREITPSTDVDMLNAIEYDLERVGKIAPTEVLAIRRPLQPHILCNVKPWNESRFLYQKDGYLPILVPAEDEHAPLRIGTLDDHDPSSASAGHQRKERSDVKFEREPISERLYLYRYQEAYRKHHFS